MDTGKVGIVLGTLALGGVVLLYLEVDRLADLVRSDRRRQRVAAPLEVAAAPDAEPAPVSRARRAGTAEPQATPPPGGVSPAKVAIPFFSADFIGIASTVDQVKGALQLTPEQVEQVKDVVERTRRRIEDVLRTPGRDGVSPRQAIDERARAAEAALGQAPKGSLSVTVQPVDFHDWPLPGRARTYGEEIELISGEGRGEIEALLDNTQKKLMKQVQFAGLFHEHEPQWVGASVTFTK